jgi:hypothetical protein
MLRAVDRGDSLSSCGAPVQAARIGPVSKTSRIAARTTPCWPSWRPWVFGMGGVLAAPQVSRPAIPAGRPIARADSGPLRSAPL